MLFKCWTHRSTATESPICTMAVPSLVLRNFIYNEIEKKCQTISRKTNRIILINLTLATFPYKQTKLKSLSVLEVSPSRPYTIMTAPCCCDCVTKLVGPLRPGAIGGSFIKPGPPGVAFQPSVAWWNSGGPYGGKPAPGPNSAGSWKRICLKG